MKPLNIILGTWIACIGIFGFTQCRADEAGCPALMDRTPIQERPWSTDPQKFTFTVIGDRTGGDSTGWPWFDRAVQEINLQRPDFVLNIGDMINGHGDQATIEAEWEEYWEHASPLQVPYMFLPGNHDLVYSDNNASRQHWHEHYGRTYYAFRYNDCLFLMLCTYEVDDDAGRHFGAEQVAFVRRTLSENTDVRNTFVLMHHPAWTYDDAMGEEWEQIAEALDDRRYTAFCGHTHTLTHSVRNGHRYIVVGTTGTNIRNNPLVEMGSFHHYLNVTVDGDSAYVSVHHPGSVWPEDIASAGFRNRLQNMTQFDVRPPDVTQTDPTAGFTANITNPFSEPVTVTMSQIGPVNTAWASNNLETISIDLGPGEQGTISRDFRVHTADMIPPPRHNIAITYRGQVIRSWNWSLPIFADEALKRVPEWSVVAPLDAGAINSDLVEENPHAAMPGVYRELGPEAGYDEDAAYGSENARWQNRSIGENGRLELAAVYGRDANKVAYTLCAVYSPEARATAAVVHGNDYCDVIVNGEAVNENRVYTLGGGPEYVPVSLRAGWNTIVVKVINLGAGWWLDFKIADPAGNLRFASHPE